MTITRLSIVFVSMVLLGAGNAAAEQPVNLFSPDLAKQIVLVVPEKAEPLEEYAASELAAHLEKVTGVKPQIIQPQGDPATALAGKANLVVLGRVKDNRLLEHLAQTGFFKPNTEEQGYSLRVDANPHNANGNSWLVVLCGADPHGLLYAVRDFSHYYFYKDDSGVVLRTSRVELAPRLKLRGLSESGCNLFSATNDRKGYLYNAALNYYSRDVVFDKQYYIDWLSEWKINYISLLWCNYAAYDAVRWDLVRYAHARGIQVLGFFVPYRPAHEQPPESVSKVKTLSPHADCPRDPKVRKWYADRLVELVSREPKIDMIQIESPYHDGCYCQCEICQGRKNPYPEDKMLEEMVQLVRKHRPEIPIVRAMNRPVPNAATARRLAEQLRTLEGPNDWYVNSHRNREHRLHWHDLGPKFATYLRPFRTALKGYDVPGEIGFVFNDFRLSAERDIVAHQFCFRFRAGKVGSFYVEQDREMLGKYPDRKGPFSLALLAEAAFDPFVQGADRVRKLERIYAMTIPDYPRGRSLTQAELKATALSTGPAQPMALSASLAVDACNAPIPSKLFRSQYSIKQPGFLHAQVCADLDGDGRRETLYSSRGTKIRPTWPIWMATARSRSSA